MSSFSQKRFLRQLFRAQDAPQLDADDEKMRALLALVTPQSQPNINALRTLASDIDNIKLNIKFFGYELARQMADALPKRRGATQARHVGLTPKPSTQADIESDWVAHWLWQLQAPVIYHRKMWELAYVLQALHENGMIEVGRRGLGFGCGGEPIPSYLAARGISVSATDLHPDAGNSRQWAKTGQHSAALDALFHAHLTTRENFDQHLTLDYVDMNAIPDTLRDYDFCWSICSLEHLGSISRGLDFVVNSLRTLRSGGLAVHTTEFNFLNDEETIDNWGTVLFQKKHFSDLADRLRAEGHMIAPLDFDVGTLPMDRFIDMPPYPHDLSGPGKELYGRDANHLKLSIDGFASTCYGLIIRKK